MSATKNKLLREGWEDAARISRLEDEAARCADYRNKACNYQIAAIRIEILADHMSRIDFADQGANDVVDAFCGAIHALSRLAQKENET